MANGCTTVDKQIKQITFIIAYISLLAWYLLLTLQLINIFKVNVSGI